MIPTQINSTYGADASVLVQNNTESAHVQTTLYALLQISKHLQSSGKSGMCYNNVQGEQITPYLENKALIQKSKTIKFEILSR